MSIDELLQDAMADELASAPSPTDGGWSTVEERSVALRRARHHRRVAAFAIGVAAAVLVGIIVVGLSNRSTPSTTDNLFVGDPTTVPVVEAMGPVPAANVTDALAPGTESRSPDAAVVSWLIARTGRTDRELIVYVLNGGPPGECGVDYAAEVRSEVERVEVTLTAVPVYPTQADGTAGYCSADKPPPVRRAIRVELPDPLGGRRIFDGARADSTGLAPVDGRTLLVPSGLPAGLTAQNEFLADTWSVCYAPMSALCSQREVAGPTLTTVQSQSSTTLIAALSLPVTPTFDPTADEDPMHWLMRSWQADADPAYASVEVDGRPALIFKRIPVDRLGSTVILWADSSSLSAMTTWFALGVSDQTGLTGPQLVALAESMQPAS